MFTYKEEPRGYWMSVSKIKKSKGFSSRTLFEGRKMFLESAKRFSKKGMENAVKKGMELYIDMVARVYGTQVLKNLEEE